MPKEGRAIMRKYARLLVPFLLFLALLVPPILAPATRAATMHDPDGVKLDLWTFASEHAKWYKAQGAEFAKLHPGFSLQVHLLDYNAHHSKLTVTFASGGIGGPDLADVEISRFGKFTKGQIPFVDLTNIYNIPGQLDQMAQSRLTPYEVKGRVYGLEVALVPVVLAYRSDLFKQAGIATPIKTWDDFMAAGKKITALGGGRYMTPLPPDVGTWFMYLLQRGGGIFDSTGNFIGNNKMGVDTLQWMLDLKKSGVGQVPPNNDVYNNAWWGAVKGGKVASVLAPDWYLGSIRDNAPELKGKWRVQPLPVWKAGGSQTSAWGGTANTISRFSSHIKQAEDFQRFLFFRKVSVIQRYKLTLLYPPWKPAWDDPALRQEDAYFSNQCVSCILGQIGPSQNGYYVPSTWPETTDAINRLAMVPALKGEKTAQKALDDVAAYFKSKILTAK